VVGGQILLPAIGFKNQRQYRGVMLPHESRSFSVNRQDDSHYRKKSKRTL